MLRHIILGSVLTCVRGLTFGFSQTTNADHDIARAAEPIDRTAYWSGFCLGASMGGPLHLRPRTARALFTSVFHSCSCPSIFAFVLVLLVVAFASSAFSQPIIEDHHDQPVIEHHHDQPVIRTHPKPGSWLFSPYPPNRTPQLPCLTEREKVVLNTLLRLWWYADAEVRSLEADLNDSIGSELETQQSSFFKHDDPALDEAGQKEVKWRNWVRREALPLARENARKAADRYHNFLRTLLNRTCQDYFEPFYPTWNYQGLKNPEVTDPGLIIEAVPPPLQGQVHVLCQKCSPLADEYNNTVQAYNEAVRAAAQAYRILSISMQAEGVTTSPEPFADLYGRPVYKDTERARQEVEAAEKLLGQLRSQLDALLAKIIECEKSCGQPDRLSNAIGLDYTPKSDANTLTPTANDNGTSKTDTPNDAKTTDTKTPDTNTPSTKTTDTKTSDTKTPSEQVKDDKPQQTDTPTAPQTGKGEKTANPTPAVPPQNTETGMVPSSQPLSMVAAALPTEKLPKQEAAACAPLQELDDKHLKALLDDPKLRARLSKLIDDVPSRNDEKKPVRENSHSKRHRTPTDADKPAPSGMSPETARAIGTMIDIGIGVGLSRSRGHHGGNDDRGDAPRRVMPKSDR